MFTRKAVHATVKSIYTSQQRNLQQNLKSPVRGGFAKSFIQDKGNIPIILANCVAVGLIVAFAGRKLLFHPDVNVASRTVDSPTRDGNSYDYMDQTRTIASILAPIAAPILKLSTGSSSSNLWELDWTRNNDKIEVPLEYSNEFNDSLFEETKPGSPAHPLIDQHNSV